MNLDVFKENKAVTFLAALLLIAFIVAGVLTIVVSLEDDSTSEPIEQVNERVVASDNDALNEYEPVKNSNAGSVSSADGKVAAAPVSKVWPEDKDPYKELDALVGLGSVKEEVTSLVNFIKVQQAREKQGLKTTPISYHCVFTGNPGTGKTTVARIMAGIYKDLGILKRGHLVETDRSGLVAEYLGQTAVKTNAIIDSALGGVLFIDEAYALAEKDDSYGYEAISTLLKRMEDDRDNLVVIVAGYTNEMKTFINSNPGLQSRFNRYIEFPDYNADELFEMYGRNLKKYDMKLDDDASEYLQEHLNMVVQRKNRNFGNGRYVRNIFEKTLTAQANRLAANSGTISKEQLSRITLDDVKNATK